MCIIHYIKAMTFWCQWNSSDSHREFRSFFLFWRNSEFPSLCTANNTKIGICTRIKTNYYDNLFGLKFEWSVEIHFSSSASHNLKLYLRMAHVELGIIPIQSSFQAQMKETKSNACSIHQIRCHIHINDFFMWATGNLYLLNYQKNGNWIFNGLFCDAMASFIAICGWDRYKGFVWHISSINGLKPNC